MSTDNGEVVKIVCPNCGNVEKVPIVNGIITLHNPHVCFQNRGEKKELFELVDANKEFPEKTNMYFVKCTLILTRDDEIYTTQGFMQLSYFYSHTKIWHVNSQKITVTHWLKPIPQSSLKEETDLRQAANTHAQNYLDKYEGFASFQNSRDSFIEGATWQSSLTPKSIRDSEGWISVKDGLPELNVEVMCYQPPVKFISGGETKGRRLSGYLFELEPDERRGDIDLELLGDRGLSLAAGGKFWAFPYICHQNFVTHWQPLPAPPNEKSASLKPNKLSDSELEKMAEEHINTPHYDDNGHKGSFIAGCKAIINKK